jgi:hypothetical protein
VLSFQLLFLLPQLLLLLPLLLPFACPLHTLTFMPPLNVSAVTSCKHTQQNTQQHACRSDAAPPLAAQLKQQLSSIVMLLLSTAASNMTQHRRLEQKLDPAFAMTVGHSLIIHGVNADGDVAMA